MNRSQSNKPQENGSESNIGKKWLWSLLAILIAFLSIWAVVSQSRDFSLCDFFEYIKTADPFWLVIAVLFMFGFIWFEGMAVRCLCRSFGYPQSRKSGFIYSASDLYFSAITPSASGGQPVCGYFMTRDGIPAVTTTVILIANLAMYTLSIIAIGILCFAFRPQIFLYFSIPSKIFIIVGCVAQLGLAVLFFSLLKAYRLVHKVCDRVLWLLGKIRLLRHPERKRDKLVRLMEDYKRCSEMIAGKTSMMIKVFIFNFLQRVSQIAVTVATYFATGGDPDRWLDVFALQSNVVLGSNCVPIPGAMGISDALMIDGFSSTMVKEEAIRLELLSRTISFYTCMIICGVAVFISYFNSKRRKV